MGDFSMRTPVRKLLLAACFLLAAAPIPASAQFGLPGMPRVGRVPLPLPGPGRILRRGPLALPGMHFGKFRRAFGVLGAVVVGSVILGRLNRREGAEVTRRTKVVLERDPDQEVQDTYRTPDGSKEVTITAGPTQKAATFKDDPVLQATADSLQQASDSDSGKGKAKSDTLQANEVVKVNELPEDANCRKVTTEMELKSTGKKKAEPTADSKTTNVAILCHAAGEWKPASI
jgi:hypothetical protein